MRHTIREKVRIQPDGIIRLISPDLPKGEVEADVIVTFNDPEQTQGIPPPLSSLIGSAKGAFSSAKEIDDFLQRERAAWD